MTEQQKKDKPADDVGKIKVSEMLRIVDKETKEVIIEKKHDSKN